MIRHLRRHAALFRLYYADVFAYRAATLIWILGDLEVALVMPFVWRAAGGIQGLPVEQVTVYYVVTMTLSQFITCHLLWDIGWDIREGQFSSLLLRPVSHLSSSLVRNLAWRTGKLVLFAPILAVLLLLYGLPKPGLVTIGPEFLVAVALAQMLAFLSAYCVAMVALWTTEFQSIFQLYYFPELLLSGRIVPLTALPDWAQALSQGTHFRYTVSFPAEIALGRLTPQAVNQGLVVQVVWIGVFFVLAKVLFARGVRQYSGFGM